MIAKKFTTLLAICLFAFVGLQGCNKGEDVNITNEVKSKIAADPTLSRSKIEVDTKDGVVSLTGTIQNPAHEQTAVRVAQSVNGVKQVNSKFTVESQTATVESQNATNPAAPAPAPAQPPAAAVQPAQ